MPVTEKSEQIFEYPLSRKGINLNKNFIDLYPDECFIAQNVVWINGMVKRGGQNLVSTNQVVSGKQIVGLHRFYNSTGTKQLLAACDTTIKYLSGSSWVSAITGQTSGLQTYMTTWGALNKAYVCNGNDSMKSWDGTTAVPIALMDGVPTQALPYQDRLLTIINTSGGGLLTWSGSFLDTYTNIPVLITDATPAVFSRVDGSNHNLNAGDAITLTTSGTLPAPLNTAQTYYVISAGLTATQFEVALTLNGSAINTTNAGTGNFYYSTNYGRWNLASSCGVRPDTYLYGMCYHAVNDTQAGFNTKILIAGSTGMYLFSGTDLRTPSTTGNYTIFPLAINVGCCAPRTMCWTPEGTIWLGNDRQVYLLPFDSATPVPIGSKIQSTSQQQGIESIPEANLKNACGAYQDGYYILSYQIGSGGYNNQQMWLDMNRLAEDDDGHFGPWYGPMTGQSISCFTIQTAPGDGGELIGGEAQAYGNVYFCNSSGVYGDILPSSQAVNPILINWQTPYNPLANPGLMKDVHKLEIELQNVLGTITVSLFDIYGIISTGSTVSLTGGLNYWNDNYWNDQYWSGSSPARVPFDISPALHVRRLSILITQNILNDTFALYGLRVAGIEQNLIFE